MSCQQIIEQSVIIQRFRNGDAQLPLIVQSGSEMGQLKKNHRKRVYQQEQAGGSQVFRSHRHDSSPGNSNRRHQVYLLMALGQAPWQ